MNIRIVYGYDLSNRTDLELFEDVEGYETPYGGNSDPAFFGIELDSFEVYDKVFISSLNLRATDSQTEEFQALFNKLTEQQKNILNECGSPQEVLVFCM